MILLIKGKLGTQMGFDYVDEIMFTHLNVYVCVYIVSSSSASSMTCQVALVSEPIMSPFFMCMLIQLPNYGIPDTTTRQISTVSYNLGSMSFSGLSLFDLPIFNSWENLKCQKKKNNCYYSKENVYQRIHINNYGFLR